MTIDTGISERKADHIELCATGDVGFHHKTTLLERVDLVHDSLPELALDEIDLSVSILGKTLRAPLVISAMTGGTPRARDINKELASIAEERGYGFGLGSQRAMLRGDRDDTYVVRDVAPTVLLLGNIGAVQARELSTDAVNDLIGRVGADAICIHLNPAQEIVQVGGDRYFAGALGAMERLAEELAVPVVAKETGCGIGPRAARRLARAHVKHLDVSGAGGTSWVAVETERAVPVKMGDTPMPPGSRSLGTALREWGVPTAAAILIAKKARPRFQTIIATGGIKSGLDAAKAIALGAHAAGIARPVLQALVSAGREGALRFLDQVEAELRAVMLLVGAGSVRALRKAQVVLSGDLPRWAALAD
jgi:isopentenyl-diphosphate delta-isomerase